ncbi:winged helix-turn-helix domain-containing protein [Enterococcus sp. LJL51]|uniref:winged helix-turn-helix domain-containing protein n=1 Tax=Enterococcus sp. LJL51 TaxID=3416656 RepID=UPI003CFA7D27
MNLGVITLSADISDKYVENLKKNQINVVSLTDENFNTYINSLDAVVIRENPAEDVSNTCSLLLKLKEYSGIFVWVFSSDSAKIMRSVYLQLGAVGIIPEDSDSEEFRLTITNSLYRKQEHPDNNEGKRTEKSVSVTPTSDKTLELIPRNFSINVKGKGEIPLTRLEYHAMETLYKYINSAVTYKELYEEVWDGEFDEKNSNYKVANLIFHLREKLEGKSTPFVYIKTVRSKGYMLVIKE